MSINAEKLLSTMAARVKSYKDAIIKNYQWVEIIGKRTTEYLKEIKKCEKELKKIKLELENL